MREREIEKMEQTENTQRSNGEAPTRSVGVQRLVSELRFRLALSNDADITDAEILEVTYGTIFRASVELHLACVDLSKAVKKEIKPIADALEKAKRALSR